KIGIEKGREEGEKIGIEKGREEGEKIGIEKERAEMARKMKADGMPFEIITKYSGLSKDEIEKL
ncbi:MAG: hypothetical protein MJ211_06250, partial [Bacteroidales bacterium]|nr:hypothetical protein [Bacteroidales bacterium]